MLSSKYLLSANEIMLLKLLMENVKGCTREQILTTIWPNKFVTENSLNVSINKLRKAFRCMEISNSIITLRSYGYKLNQKIQLIFKHNEEEVLDYLKQHNKAANISATPSLGKMKLNANIGTYPYLYVVIFIAITLVTLIHLQ